MNSAIHLKRKGNLTRSKLMLMLCTVLDVTFFLYIFWFSYCHLLLLFGIMKHLHQTNSTCDLAGINIPFLYNIFPAYILTGVYFYAVLFLFPFWNQTFYQRFCHQVTHVTLSPGSTLDKQISKCYLSVRISVCVGVCVHRCPSFTFLNSWDVRTSTRIEYKGTSYVFMTHSLLSHRWRVSGWISVILGLW